MSQTQYIAQLTSGQSININRLGDPGSPTYPGAIDYPDTVYQGYPGSSNYIWERQSSGYPFLNVDKALPSMIPNRLWKRESFGRNIAKTNSKWIYMILFVVMIYLWI
jgi:hypothetical protein